MGKEQRAAVWGAACGPAPLGPLTRPERHLTIKSHSHSDKATFLECSTDGMESGLPTRKAGALPLEPHSSPFSSGYLGDGGLVNYLPGLASISNPPDQSQPPK
jgi:hypothetical protein